MIILCILITAIFLYITIKAKSVIAAAIIHGTMNATAGISIMLLDGGNDLTVGITGLAGFITIAIFIFAIFIYDYFISKDKILGNRISNYLWDFTFSLFNDGFIKKNDFSKVSLQLKLFFALVISQFLPINA